MQFYTKKHKHYCGIDLHTRIIYLCILNNDGEVLLHKQTHSNPESLMKLIKPYLDDLIITVECMFTWYWPRLDQFNWPLTTEHNIKFILGHALYMKAIHGGKAKNDKIDSYKIAKLLNSGMLPQAYVYPEHMRATRDLMRRRTFFVRECAELKTHVKIMNHQYNLPALSLDLKVTSNHETIIDRFDDASAKRSVQADTDSIRYLTKKITSIEFFIKKQAKVDDYQSFMLIKSIKGVGDVLAMTILYEIHTIERFPTVQKFASYCRLIKCKAESAGKIYGTSGNKIGNAHLKWALTGILRSSSSLFTRQRKSKKISCSTGKKAW